MEEGEIGNQNNAISLAKKSTETGVLLYFATDVQVKKSDEERHAKKK